MNPLITIRPADYNDLTQLAHLSAQTFYDAFAHLNNAEDVLHYINTTYSENNLFLEMNQPGTCFYLAELDGQAVGYLKLNYGNSQTEFQKANEAEIQRLYVLSAYQGRRIGEQLIQFAIGQALQNNCTTIWLGVWEHNTNAIRFYERHGFTLFGKHDFLLGNDLQTDFLMKRPIVKE